MVLLEKGEYRGDTGTSRRLWMGCEYGVSERLAVRIWNTPKAQKGRQGTEWPRILPRRPQSYPLPCL